MSQILPLVPSLPLYRFNTTLGDRQFGFRLRWNGRDEAWYMDVEREDGTVLRRAIRVVLGVLLGGRSVDPDFPPGGFRAVDLKGTGVDAGLDDLGDRVAIYYLTPEELIAP